MLLGVALSKDTQGTFNKGGNYFAWALGVGVNRRISDRMAIRLFFFLFAMNRNESDKNNHVRASVGFVFKLGKRAN